MKLSILIPFYNEGATLEDLIDKVSQVVLHGIDKELILIDDCSTDDSSKIVSKIISQRPDLDLKFMRHASNLGKGAAIRSGLKLVSGDYVLIQDADLEYEPDDYPSILYPVLQGEAEVVYGNRFENMKMPASQYTLHYLANRFLTWLSNCLTGLNLRDMECCYKLIPTRIFKALPLKENSFGFEPEVTAYLSRIKGLRIAQVPIRYYGRKYHEGKKIGLADGVRAIYCILYYNIKVPAFKESFK